MDEKKDIQSMNIEELRVALHETNSQLREREENIHVLQNDVDMVSKERDQYKSWWLEEQEQLKVLSSKLDALKGIVNAI